VLCNYNDKDTKYFLDRGGVINQSEMEKKGFTTMNYKSKYWLFSKDTATQNKLIDAWIEKINANKLDLR